MQLGRENAYYKSEMRNDHSFLLESDGTTHDLVVDAQNIGRFTTLKAAEAAANDIARRIAPGATLRFELGFRTTLMDLEIRAATLDWESEEVAHR
jgi:hypothetical protein